MLLLRRIMRLTDARLCEANRTPLCRCAVHSYVHYMDKEVCLCWLYSALMPCALLLT